MNYIHAKKYVAAYAAFQKISFKDVMDIDTDGRFRGNVYNIEFEYDSLSRILIARGYLYHSTDETFRQDVWDKHLAIQHDPTSSETKELLSGKSLDFSTKIFEMDRTIKEIEPQYFYRQNLRMDFVASTLTENDFVKTIKALADESFIFEKYHENKIVEACNKILMPRKAEIYIKSYAKSVHLLNVSIEKGDGWFRAKVNKLLFHYDNKDGELLISKEMVVTKSVLDDIKQYNSKIKNDVLWYWRAAIVKNNQDGLILLIKIGVFDMPETDVIAIIDHCLISLTLWQQEFFDSDKTF